MSRVSLVAAGAFLLLGGCAAIGGPKTEVAVFAPVSAPTADPAWPTVAWSLSVGTDAANQMLDSDRIAVRPTPERFQAYKGARWADNAPELLQTAVLEAFEDSGRIRSVGRFAGSGSRSDFGLLLEVRAFETDYASGRPEAVVEVQARLVQFRGGGVVASKRFRQAVPGATPEIDAMVGAFGKALSALETELVGWTLAEGERATTESAGARKP